MVVRSQTVRAAVRRLREMGFAVCKPDPREKKPTYRGWSTRSLEQDDFTERDQVGIIGGALSDGNRPGHSLVEVDLDATDAVRLADEYLPATGMSEGRAGKPRSHRYYLVPNDSVPNWAVSQAEQASAAALEQKGHPGPFKKAFDLRADGARAIDFIGTGGQVVCPPATWVSRDGKVREPREWGGGEPGEPAIVAFLDLWRAVCELASACGASIPDVLPRPRATASRAPTDLTTRAAKWLAKPEGAVSGQRGHNKLMWVARALVWGFDLGPEESLRLLADQFNPRCQPPWSMSELRHKVEDADRIPFNKPRGWLRDQERPPATGRKAPEHMTGNRFQSTPPVRANLETKGEAVPAGNSPPPVALASRALADVVSGEVRWIWPGFVPAGMLTILDGDPADGKSTITIDIGARFSCGRAMPSCLEPTTGPGAVLFLAAEDSAEYTLKPRADAAGADLNLFRVSECVRIGEHERPIRLPDDMQALEREILAFKVGLVIIDPFLGFLSQAIDSHKDQSIREVLHELKLVAGRTGCAVLALRHLSKGGAGGNALYRGIGSIGITAAARSALAVGAHPTEDGARVLASAKLNIGPPPKSLVYRIENHFGQPIINWCGPCDLTARDLGAVAVRERGGAAVDAVAFLRDRLASGGKPQAEVVAEATALGIKERTLERAKKNLKVKSAQNRGFWMWELPDVTPERQTAEQGSGRQLPD
ncbi:AAA family ATPase [Gemmata massiliana]|uniref:AAA family ATPase n=1 Tax=Gemmata massiliana TaxID=1210884 RepID=UPI0013A70BF9|nr:AAA family ATPase [Gemmata massiliana]